jgi:hypothetical protein
VTDKSITQITMDKVREEWEAPLRAHIATLEKALRAIQIASGITDPDEAANTCGSIARAALRGTK